MIRNIAIASALALTLAACGSSEEAADDTVGNAYDPSAPSLEDVASDAEMEALEAQEEALEEEAAPPPPAIDESEVTVDFNHPLAGRTIVFDVHIHRVEPAELH